MQSIKAIPTRSHTRHSYLPKALSKCSHVLVRHDAVRVSLQKPYDGPYKVIYRGKKHYTLMVNGRKSNVSIDRLKPAFIDRDDRLSNESKSSSHSFTSLSSPSPPSLPSPSSLPPPTPTTPTSSSSRTTRSGRHVHWPKQLEIYC